MKRIMFIFGILFCNSTHPAATIATQAKSVTSQIAPGNNNLPPIHVTVNNNISQEQTDNSNRNVTHTATQEHTTTLQAAQVNNQETIQANNQEATQTTITSMKNDIKTVIKERVQEAQDHLNLLKEWTKENKYKLIIACGCSAYAALFAYLVRGNLRMQDEALWARWRIEDSFEQLASIPHKQLAQDLVFAIQRRYTSETQFTDFILPLTHFLHDVAQEKKLLKNYLAAGRWIMRLQLHYILPTNQKKMELAQSLLQRLCFIEHVFLSWAAEFKIQQNMITS